jgi:predicted nucleic acid-binding protein
MSGSRLFVDTNILIYLLKVDSTLETFLKDKQLYISFITEMELLGFPNISSQEEVQIKTLLSQCVIVDLEPGIKELAISTRKNYKLRLPDSIIVASALFLDIPFITADKGLQRLEETLGLIIYEP